MQCPKCGSYLVEPDSYPTYENPRPRFSCQVCGYSDKENRFIGTKLKKVWNPSQR